MTDNKKEEKSRRKVLIAMDGSKHALFAFECKLVHLANNFVMNNQFDDV